MKNSILSKFIAIVLLLTFLLIATLAFITISVANNSQSDQANAFIKVIKDEQTSEEELLRKTLFRKGESLMKLLAQNGATLIIGYDFDTLQQLAANGASDQEIAFVTFYNIEGRPITPKPKQTEGIQVIKQEVLFEDEVIGTVEVGLDDTFVKNSIAAVTTRIEQIVQDTAKTKEKATAFIIGLTAFVSVIGVVLLCLAIFVLLLYVVIKPIQQVISFARKMSEGDLSVSLDINAEDESRQDEIGQLLSAMDYMAGTLKTKVDLADKISHGDLAVDVTLASEADTLGKALQKMLNTLRTKVELANFIAQGNLSVDVTMASDADTLGKALREMVSNLNVLLSKVNSAAEGLKNSSAQISESSHNLSQGASEQAASLEQITSSMEELESQTKSNSENAKTASQQSTEAKSQAEEGNIQMQNMLEAMNEINVTSEQISNIIKTIDEIAFQTNVLAINAAVEAARAGEHGKGFAVVAEEVRNLAQRSAEASKETTAMIKDSIKRIEAGAKTADQTAQSLSVISTGTANVTNLVQEIAASSNEQALGVSQINQGLNQLNSIVQTNASIAEKSASASESLDTQANILAQLVSNFQLKSQMSVGQEPQETSYQHQPAAKQLPLSGYQESKITKTPHQIESYKGDSSGDILGENYVSFEDENIGRF